MARLKLLIIDNNFVWWYNINMKIENIYKKEQAIVPTATNEAEAVKIFEFYYAKHGYFQVQVSQLDHMFFEPVLYNIYYDVYEKPQGENRKRKIRHNFYCVENLVRLKKYGEIYLDLQLKANKNDAEKSVEDKELFAKTFKKYKTRLSKAFDEKLEYIKDLALLKELEKVEHRKLVREKEVARLLDQYKLADADNYFKIETKINAEYDEKIKAEQQLVNKALGCDEKKANRAKKGADKLLKNDDVNNQKELLNF